MCVLAHPYVGLKHHSKGFGKQIYIKYIFPLSSSYVGQRYFMPLSFPTTPFFLKVLNYASTDPHIIQNFEKKYHGLED